MNPKSFRPFSDYNPLLRPFSPLASRLTMLLCVTLPTLIMIPLFWQEARPRSEEPEYWDEMLYQMYHHMQEPEVSRRMVVLFVALYVVCAASMIYGIWVLACRKNVKGPVWVGVSCFYALWLTLAIYNLPSFRRVTTTPWLFMCTLAMIPLLCSLAHVVLWLTPRDREHSIKKTLLPLMAVPMVWYLLFNTFRYSYSLTQNDRKSTLTMVIMLAVVSTYCLLFILFRLLYLLAMKREQFWRVTRIVVLFFLPLMGLLVTQITPDFSFFWDFSSPVYYLLTILNGVLLMLRQPRRYGLRLLLFFGRCSTYVFVTYFFICISPFYTLSLLGLLVFGLGLLVLAPLFLWIYQTKLLVESGRELLRTVGWVRTLACGLAGAVVLPALVVLSFRGDKSNFDRALYYLDGAVEVVGEDMGPVDLKALSRSEDYVQYSVDNLYFSYTNRYQTRKPPPMLRQVYNSIVNGGEEIEYGTLSKINALYHGYQNELTGLDEFYDYRSYYNVEITGIQTETTFDGMDYRSVVHFTMENLDEFEDLAEYRTSFRMPDGVFITDYYLDVEGVRKSGLLSERSAAVSLFQDVVYSARDPGILYYDGEYITFRVFPFAAEEVRYTGVEFLHREPVTLEIDGNSIYLGDEEAPQGRMSQPLDSGNGILYFSALSKESLPAVRRDPLYQFVVDCSQDSDIDALVERIQEFCRRQEVKPEQATVTALNYRRAVWEMTDSNWAEGVRSFPAEAGFGLGFVDQTITREFDGPDGYPVMIVVTDDPYGAILPNDIAYMAERSPEIDGYYLLMGGEENRPALYLVPFDNRQSNYLVSGLPDPPQMRLAQVNGETVYLRDNGAPQVVLTGSANVDTSQTVTRSGWEQAMQLYGHYLSTLEIENDSQRALAQLNLIKNSFRTGIMTPYTSYIVLETEEQEKELIARQERILEELELESLLDELGGTNPDDFGGGKGSEPSILIFLAALVPFVVYKRRKNRSVPAAA